MGIFANVRHMCLEGGPISLPFAACAQEPGGSPQCRGGSGTATSNQWISAFAESILMIVDVLKSWKSEVSQDWCQIIIGLAAETMRLPAAEIIDFRQKIARKSRTRENETFKGGEPGARKTWISLVKRNPIMFWSRKGCRRPLTNAASLTNIWQLMIPIFCCTISST